MSARIRPGATRLYRVWVDDPCTSLARPFQRKPYASSHAFGPYDSIGPALAQRTVDEAAGGTAHIEESDLEWGEWCGD